MTQHVPFNDASDEEVANAFRESLTSENVQLMHDAIIGLANHRMIPELVKILNEHQEWSLSGEFGAELGSSLTTLAKIMHGYGRAEEALMPSYIGWLIIAAAQKLATGERKRDSFSMRDDFLMPLLMAGQLASASEGKFDETIVDQCADLLRSAGLDDDSIAETREVVRSGILGTVVFYDLLPPDPRS